MPTYLSPGIYTRETDFSFYVKQISTSSAAMTAPAGTTSMNARIYRPKSRLTSGDLVYIRNRCTPTAFIEPGKICDIAESMAYAFRVLGWAGHRK